MRHSRRSLVFLFLILVGGLATPAPSPAPVGPRSRPGVEVVVYATHTDAPPPKVLPPAAFSQRARGVGAQTATITVNYHGFSTPAQTAFQLAVDIWASLISSPVPIVVDATWTPLPPGVLGSAGPRNFYSDFPNAPVTNTWYPVATANKLAGSDLDPTDYDIRARFSSVFPAWYFGTDGNPSVNEYDFVSVVLHELGHGLGFVGSMEVDNPNSPTTANWGEGTPNPFIFDRFAVNGSSQLLITSFPNDTAEMLSQVTSDDLYFNGANAVAANGGQKPRLYAPAVWEEGSSYSHLDEDTYPGGNVNALMTPALGNGEVAQNPGPITLCMFKDMGWTVSVSGAAVGATRPAVRTDLFFLDNASALAVVKVYLPLIATPPQTSPPAGC